jgi:hypothetical protein
MYLLFSTTNLRIALPLEVTQLAHPTHKSSFSPNPEKQKQQNETAPLREKKTKSEYYKEQRP